MFFFEICEIFKNTYFEENLRKTAFVSPRNTVANSSGKFELDESSTECKASIFLNITVLFVQMQRYQLPPENCPPDN